MKKTQLLTNFARHFALLISLAGIFAPAMARGVSAPRAPYASDKPLPEPVLFGVPQPVGADDAAWHMTITPDGKTIYFLTGSGFEMEVVMETHFVDGSWSRPEVAPFSGFFRMESPSISPGGSRFFFDKPHGAETDIWVMDKTETGWSEARDLGAPVNRQGFRQYGPSATADGNLYFSSNRDGRMSIYCSRPVGGKYTEPEKLGDAVNQYAALQPAIASDESFLIFCSNRPGGQGGEDLHVSFRENGMWTPARNLGPKINSRAFDRRPVLSPDGKYLFFTSGRGFGDDPLEKRLTYPELQALLKSPLNGRGNIYQVDIGAALHAAAGSR
jgi:Tol biopolymer transport system component